MTKLKPDRAVDAAVARALERTPPLTDATKTRIALALQPQAEALEPRSA